MSFPDTAWVFAVVALASCVQGSIGFGMALVAAPLLALIDPALVPGPLISSVLLLVVMIAIRDRAHVDFATVRWAILGCIGGAIVGASVVAMLDPRGFAILFGGLVLLAVGLSASGLHVRVTPISTLLAGVLGGFMGTTSSIGGPALALVYQHQDTARFRGTLTSYFILSSAIYLTALGSVGRYGQGELELALQLVPGVVAGFLLSIWTSRLLRDVRVRPIILTLSAGAGATLLLRVL